jgi:hypothetical protein
MAQKLTVSEVTPRNIHTDWVKQGQAIKRAGNDKKSVLMDVIDTLCGQLPNSRRSEMKALAWPLATLSYPVKNQDLHVLCHRKIQEGKARMAELIGEENIPDFLFEPDAPDESDTIEPPQPITKTNSDPKGIVQLMEMDAASEDDVEAGVSDRDVNWVYHNVQRANVTIADAPSPGAWGLLQFARANPTEFYKTHVGKVLSRKPPEQDKGSALPNAADYDALELALSECLAIARQKKKELADKQS